MAIAYRYGISNVVDAYQLTLTLITWLPATFVAVLSVVLVPALGRDAREDPRRSKRSFLGELDVMAIVVGVLFAVILYFSWPYALDLMARNLSEETRVMSRRMMLGMAPVGILMLTICVYAARLQAREKHVNTLLECVPAVVLLGFVLAWHDAGSPAPLIWGTTLGFIVPGGDTGRAVRAADKIRARFSFSLSSPQWPHMYRAVGVFMIGQLIMSLATPLDQYFVAGLGDGADRDARLCEPRDRADRQHGRRGDRPGDLAGFIRAFECRRSRSRTKHRAKVVAPHAGDRQRGGGGGVAPRADGREAAVSARCVHAADTVAVSGLFRWGLIQIPFYFAVLVLVQLFASEGRFKAMAVIAAANFAVKAVANYVLIRWFGITGVVLATGVMGASSFGCYLFLTLSNGSFK